MITRTIKHMSHDETLQIEALLVRRSTEDAWAINVVRCSMFADGSVYNISFSDRSDRKYFEDLLIEKAEAQVLDDGADKYYENKKNDLNEEQDND